MRDACTASVLMELERAEITGEVSIRQKERVIADKDAELWRVREEGEQSIRGLNAKVAEVEGVLEHTKGSLQERSPGVYGRIHDFAAYKRKYLSD